MNNVRISRDSVSNRHIFYFYKEENIRVCCSFSVNIISVYKLQHRHNLNIFIMSIVKWELVFSRSKRLCLVDVLLRCADLYPRICILRISAILTDTDRIRILCHRYSTVMHYAFILFHFFKFYFMYIVNIRHRHKLQVIKLSSVDIDASSRQISRDSWVMSDVISSFCERTKLSKLVWYQTTEETWV